MEMRNTAGREMIEDFKELKKQGITTFILSAFNYDTGKWYTSVIRRTANGVSSYANKMYQKYGDAIKVEVEHLDNDFNIKTYCTYSA